MQEDLDVELIYVGRAGGHRGCGQGAQSQKRPPLHPLPNKGRLWHDCSAREPDTH